MAEVAMADVAEVVVEVRVAAEVVVEMRVAAEVPAGAVVEMVAGVQDAVVVVVGIVATGVRGLVVAGHASRG